MRGIDLKFDQYPITRKLLWSIGCALVVSLLISSFWLFHEVRELMEQVVERAATNPQRIFEHSEREVLGAIFVPMLVALLSSLGLTFIVVRQVVDPLMRLAQHLKQQKINHLTPFHTSDKTHEIQTIVNSFNELIQKVELAFIREKQFTADVSHELRTPIAGIRLHLELLESSAPEQIKPLIQRLDQMQHSIDQLLTIARTEQTFVSGSLNEIDLVNDVLLCSYKEFEEILSTNSIQLKVDTPESTKIHGEAVLLRLLLRNLIENSSRYADEHTLLEIRIYSHRDVVCLEILDQGPGVDIAQLESLTKAFSRIDQRGKGVGLGLNIVARIAEIHDAELSINNRVDCSGLLIQLRFKNKALE